MHYYIQIIILDFSHNTHPDALQYPTTFVQSQLHPQFPLPGGVSLPSLTTPTQSSEEAADEEAATSFLTVVREKPQGTVEMLIQDCPVSLVKGFIRLFPGLESKTLTVITLCEKTKNDMTGWSHDVECERDLLLEHVSVGVSTVHKCRRTSVSL